ncbi:twin-arginine translocation signal domain-containing protein, partial [Escherichia coli]|uniref:twin-arginine translocation signal domain-containing protein n=1 Tax=Escherichia coli TaxID=562 RepID=UPI00202315A0
MCIYLNLMILIKIIRGFISAQRLILFRLLKNKEITMQRRDFLKYSVALGVASALPLWNRAV